MFIPLINVTAHILAQCLDGEKKNCLGWLSTNSLKYSLPA